MVIFRFFQQCCRPPSWICDARVLIAHEGHLVVFITAKFGWNRRGNFDNMQVFAFCELGLKTPIHASRMGVFWGCDPITVEQSRRELVM